MPNISSMSARYRIRSGSCAQLEGEVPRGRGASFPRGSPSIPLHSSNPAAFDEDKSPEATPADGF